MTFGEAFIILFERSGMTQADFARRGHSSGAEGRGFESPWGHQRKRRSSARSVACLHERGKRRRTSSALLAGRRIKSRTESRHKKSPPPRGDGLGVVVG